MNTKFTSNFVFFFKTISVEKCTKNATVFTAKLLKLAKIMEFYNSDIFDESVTF